jgi:hypothetical protein
MGQKFFAFTDNGILNVGAASEQYDFIDCVMSAVPSGVPFYIFDAQIDSFPSSKDGTYFFDSWELDTSYNPDGIGLSAGGHAEWLEYKQKNKFDNNIIYEEMKKNKTKKIIINMNKAKNIWKDILREQRKPILEALDVQYIRSLERNDTKNLEKVSKKKQFLRDITQDPRIEHAKNTDDLREVNIPPNFIEE